MNTKNKRFWIGIASKEYVKMGVAGGFSQLCHGKAQPLKRMAVGDGLIYYSSKEKFGEDALCQQFTAIGEVVGSEVYQFEMYPGFVPHRRDIHFHNAKDVSIRQLIQSLSFIKDKTHWGYAFRFDYLEIPRVDFEFIAQTMMPNVALVE